MNAISNQTKQAKQLTIRDRINSEEFKAAIADILPEHITPERMARVALTALTRTPLLADCDQHSFFRCLMDLSQWGLEPDGRRAHLIPFKNNRRGVVECQLIIDYKGYIELVYRSGLVSNVHADVVHVNDDFEYNMGEVLRHIPWYLRGEPDIKEPGEVLAAYCRCQLKDGTVKTEILSRDEVEGIRRRSRASGSGPWVTDWNEMAKKTAFRRVSKWLPLSAEVRDAIDKDDDIIVAKHTSRAATKSVSPDQFRAMVNMEAPEMLAEKEPDTEDSDGEESSEAMRRWEKTLMSETNRESLLQYADDMDGDALLTASERSALASLVQSLLLESEVESET